ncbi:MAG: homoserine O-acetyltransferase [Acidimicrobiales bacterium]|nr:homoserine O-acetyltransferase [Acidimicrobiales bacterium]
MADEVRGESDPATPLGARGGPTSGIDDNGHPLADLGRRAHPSALPASGAWRPGDDPGNRRFVTVAGGRPFALEGGTVLDSVEIAYETYGTLNADASNAILVCHALTGDSHVAGPQTRAHPTPGWWNGSVGPGKAIDTDRYFVVCPNVLGGCQGSTGPASPHPDDGKPYGSRFPVVSIRDMVRSQIAVAEELGINRWHSVIGGSMGGMQALEWAIMYPHRVGSIAVIASCEAASAQQIGWWSVGRRVIRMDPAWRDGDYYDAEPGDGPHEGLAAARMVSQITFRSDSVFTDRFGRELVDSLDGFQLWQRFQVERYLEYHGDKLVRRFDANTYLVLTKAMDLHDIGRGRDGPEHAMQRIDAPVLSVGVTSDLLYPHDQARRITDQARAVGVPAAYRELDSPHGHDAFLIEHEAVAEVVAPFLENPTEYVAAFDPTDPRNDTHGR